MNKPFLKDVVKDTVLQKWLRWIIGVPINQQGLNEMVFNEIRRTR